MNEQSGSRMISSGDHDTELLVVSFRKITVAFEEATSYRVKTYELVRLQGLSFEGHVTLC